MVLKYYADMHDLPVSDLLKQSSIKTENNLINFSDSHWKYCPDTNISTGLYIIFYQCGPIHHGTHVPGPVAQSSTEIKYNAEYNVEMDLAHFKMFIYEFLNKNL